MGNYRITIEGVGAHHNDTHTHHDADYLAQNLVDLMRRAGHNLQIARFDVVAPASSTTPGQSYRSDDLLAESTKPSMDKIVAAACAPAVASSAPMLTQPDEEC